MSDLFDDLNELHTLVPALSPALARDRGMGHGRGGPSKDLQPSPHNEDVANVIDLLEREVPELLAELAEAMEYGAPSFTTVEHAVRDLVVFVLLLDGPLADALEESITELVGRWLHAVRVALGLAAGSRPLGDNAYCPNHPSDSVVLLVGGKEGDLMREGYGEAISWTFDESIFCPGCGRRWSKQEWAGLFWKMASIDKARTPFHQLAEAVEAQRLADGPALARAYGVSENTIRSWANRGDLERHSRDSRGRTRYDIRQFERLVERMRGMAC